jgi:hypothetical protein
VITTPAAPTIISATRHPTKWLSATTVTGAAAHPRLPEIPCTLYARPTRVALTEPLRMA